MQLSRSLQFLIGTFFSFSFHSSATSINLEKQFAQKHIVLENKQIEIPGFPYAFNPSIVRYRDSLLMSIRIIPNRKDSFVTYIGLIWLDDDFNPIGYPQFLNPRSKDSTVPSRAEDARLIAVGDKLYIVYDDNEETKISKGGFRVYVAELVLNQTGQFEIKDKECLSIFEGESKDVREKSWVPFEYNNELLLAYSLIPHKILKPRLDGSNTCDMIALSEAWSNWNYGTPRGGTSGLLVGDEYLSFFHSSMPMETVHSENKNVWHYFMGAYTFSAKPPFNITKVSPIPIVGAGFYSGKKYISYWKPVKVVFPAGFIMDENYVWVVYGRDDHEIWVTKIDKENLISSLIPMET